MDDIVLESYLKAGRAVAKALELSRKLTRPGTNYSDLALLCEEEIKKNGAELSFPINISLNEEAAHYSPIINDKLKVPDHGLIKIDCGSHVNGYIADAAITINIGNDGNIYQELVKAAEDGLQAAISNFKVGVDVLDIGKFIHRAITAHGVKPVSNLGGHELGNYSLHTGVFIPNAPGAGESYKIQQDKAYAIEPFSTNGYGQIKNGPLVTIYRVLNTNKKNLKLEDRVLAQSFKKKFSSLPFSPRWIDFISDKSKINEIVDRFYKLGIIDGYHVFIEIAKGLVAQAEHTVITHKGETRVTTVVDNGL
jgi:methionyl aminopeptidase